MLFTLLMLVAAPPVTAVAYSPDGKQVAAGFRDEARVLDAATGTTVRTIPLKRGRVTALAYAPDGSLASADGDPSVAGVVTVTGPSPGDVSVTLTAHKDIVYALAFSPDGKLLATGGYDRTVKLWATPLRADSQPAATLTDHSDAVYALAFSPDGKLLASAGADRTVKVWDAATRKRLFTLGEPTDWVYAVAWHPDGKSLYAGGVDRSLRSWAITPAGGTLTASVFAHEGPVTRVLVGPKGANATAGRDPRRGPLPGRHSTRARAVHRLRPTARRGDRRPSEASGLPTAR
jgi:WD40 repeat protein